MSDRAETIQVIAEAIRAARINDECDSDAIAGDILAALEASGRAVVPKEPTARMIIAGASAKPFANRMNTQTAAGVWFAMLAAALPPSKE